MTRVDINRGETTPWPHWKTKTKQRILNFLPALLSLTSWQPGRERARMRSSHRFLCDSTVMRTFTQWLKKHSHSHARTHTHTHNSKWDDLPVFKGWDVSQLQKERSYCFKDRQKKNPLYCRSAVLSQLIACWDILAIKKWYMRALNPPQSLKSEVRIYTRRQDDIMAFGMRRHVCCMYASFSTGRAVRMMMIRPPYGWVRLASMMFFRLVIFYVHAEGLSWSKKLSQEYTHKYCLFLACLKAARVWSLLKSPESDSKTSSIRIPAFDLHMSLIVVLMHNVATNVWMFLSMLRVCICLLTSSGSAISLIVFNILMCSSVWTC